AQSRRTGPVAGSKARRRAVETRLTAARARLTAPLPVLSRVLATYLRVTHCASTDGIDGIVGETIAILVVAGAAVARGRQSGAGARRPQLTNATAHAEFAEPRVAVRAARTRRTLDAGPAFVRSPITIGVVAGRGARVCRCWLHRARACPPVATTVVGRHNTGTLARSTRADPVFPRMRLARLDAPQRTATDIIDQVIGLTVAVVVRRRGAITLCRVDRALAVGPNPSCTSA